MLPAVQPTPRTGRIHIERTCVLAETRRRNWDRRPAVPGKGSSRKTVKVSLLLSLSPFARTLFNPLVLNLF